MGEMTFQLRTDYITLGQLIKALNLIGSGAEVKMYLAEGDIYVNGEEENRRGKKLRVGDIVKLPDGESVRMV